MKILAIESSCDETAAAVATRLGKQRVSILANVVSSQIDAHKLYGGVVPEVAARLHLEKIIPVIDRALREAKCNRKNIGAIAVTEEPGLLPSLLVGQSAARALALAWKKSLIKVNHLHGHIYSVFIAQNAKQSVPQFPALALVVSGGHTGFWLIRDFGWERLIGQTLDDAVGESFDKVAQLLGLSYPGGPAVSKAAENGNPRAYNFPRPMIQSGDFNFSFSGLKTAVLTALTPNPSPLRDEGSFSLPTKWGGQGRGDLAASFQQAVVDTLHSKLAQALLKYPVRSVILAGGVAANPAIRWALRSLCREKKVKFYVPELKYCGDNAAMIAAACLLRLRRDSAGKPLPPPDKEGD